MLEKYAGHRKSVPMKFGYKGEQKNGMLKLGDGDQGPLEQDLCFSKVHIVG